MIAVKNERGWPQFPNTGQTQANTADNTPGKGCYHT
jgi:hypothetical protein